ncbi:glycosyltransferase family 2 protein [Neobacillus sp. SM06]|uniref:glycosyltransferase family 2 protein n=1 Tax=Neobacillus sp. SM06 TaxID=3422492 RepID=UPI003D2A6FA0
MDYITGCSLLFRKELIDSIGLMHEDYFLYFEETDWNIRAKQNGWGIRYVPDSIVYHKVSISSGGENNLAPYVDYYQLRNLIAMILRTQKGLIKTVSLVNIFTILLKKLIKIFIKNQNRKLERTTFLFKAVNDGFKQKMGNMLNN